MSQTDPGTGPPFAQAGLECRAGGWGPRASTQHRQELYSPVLGSEEAGNILFNILFNTAAIL